MPDTAHSSAPCCPTVAANPTKTDVQDLFIWAVKALQEKPGDDAYGWWQLASMHALPWKGYNRTATAADPQLVTPPPAWESSEYPDKTWCVGMRL